VDNIEETCNFKRDIIMKKNIILLGVFLLCLNVYAQSKKLTIKVTDDKNKPVAGAIILFDDVKQKRWTNSKGIFKTKLELVPKEISAFHPKVGIKKMKYNGSENIFIKIEKGENLLVADNNNPKAKTVNSSQFHSIYDYLRGRFPGVNIDTNNTITIRGYNTVNGSTTPLFVLNGSSIGQETFGTISPSDIKSITIIKGPESAMYGVRGANGVIVVITK
jgi:TonB-dependent SusC/RagA subfamily outer membrane receptor